MSEFIYLKSLKESPRALLKEFKSKFADNPYAQYFHVTLDDRYNLFHPQVHAALTQDDNQDLRVTNFTILAASTSSISLHHLVEQPEKPTYKTYSVKRRHNIELDIKALKDILLDEIKLTSGHAYHLDQLSFYNDLLEPIDALPEEFGSLGISFKITVGEKIERPLQVYYQGMTFSALRMTLEIYRHTTVQAALLKVAELISYPVDVLDFYVNDQIMEKTAYLTDIIDDNSLIYVTFKQGSELPNAKSVLGKYIWPNKIEHVTAEVSGYFPSIKDLGNHLLKKQSALTETYSKYELIYSDEDGQKFTYVPKGWTQFLIDIKSHNEIEGFKIEKSIRVYLPTAAPLAWRRLLEVQLGLDKSINFKLYEPRSFGQKGIEYSYASNKLYFEVCLYDINLEKNHIDEINNRTINKINEILYSENVSQDFDQLLSELKEDEQRTFATTYFLEAYLPMLGEFEDEFYRRISSSSSERFKIYTKLRKGIEYIFYNNFAGVSNDYSKKIAALDRTLSQIKKAFEEAERPLNIASGHHSRSPRKSGNNSSIAEQLNQLLDSGDESPETQNRIAQLIAELASEELNQLLESGDESPETQKRIAQLIAELDRK